MSEKSHGRGSQGRAAERTKKHERSSRHDARRRVYGSLTNGGLNHPAAAAAASPAPAPAPERAEPIEQRASARGPSRKPASRQSPRMTRATIYIDLPLVRPAAARRQENPSRSRRRLLASDDDDGTGNDLCDTLMPPVDRQVHGCSEPEAPKPRHLISCESSSPCALRRSQSSS